jgi:hypothetical protein
MGTLVLWLLAATQPEGAAADVRRMEAVGAAPIRIGEQIRVPLRDEALKRALGDAVVRVALDLLAPEVSPEFSPYGEVPLDTLADPGAASSEATEAEETEEKIEDRLAAALGDDPLDFAVRFRILEDRGERPALFVDDPEVESEYVIVVEVFVDTERVRRRLAAQGFALLPTGEGALVQIRLELLDVNRFGAYEAVRRALAADSRVRSVIPVEMERGRIVLEVQSGHQPEELLERLYQAIPPEIQIDPVVIGEGRLTLRITLRSFHAESEAGAVSDGTVAAPGN